MIYWSYIFISKKHAALQYGYCCNNANDFFQEIAKADLKSLQEQYESLKVEVSDLEGKSGKLDQLYSEQDAILDKVFGGAYGRYGH